MRQESLLAKRRGLRHQYRPSIEAESAKAMWRKAISKIMGGRIGDFKSCG